jgi:hypothetical protein
MTTTKWNDVMLPHRPFASPNYLLVGGPLNGTQGVARVLEPTLEFDNPPSVSVRARGETPAVVKPERLLYRFTSDNIRYSPAVYVYDDAGRHKTDDEIYRLRPLTDVQSYDLPSAIPADPFGVTAEPLMTYTTNPSSTDGRDRIGRRIAAVLGWREMMLFTVAACSRLPASAKSRTCDPWFQASIATTAERLCNVGLNCWQEIDNAAKSLAELPERERRGAIYHFLLPSHSNSVPTNLSLDIANSVLGGMRYSDVIDSRYDPRTMLWYRQLLTLFTEPMPELPCWLSPFAESMASVGRFERHTAGAFADMLEEQDMLATNHRWLLAVLRDDRVENIPMPGVAFLERLLDVKNRAGLAQRPNYDRWREAVEVESIRGDVSIRPRP